VFVGVLLTGVTGCGGTVRPPANVREPVPIYVTDYGRHSTLLLPTDDGRLEEFAFGDWDWLAAYHRTWHDGLIALFFANGSTLGRRYFSGRAPPPDFMGVPGRDNYFALFADRTCATALRDRLNAQWQAAAGTVVKSPGDDFYYVHIAEKYSLLHNCNHVMAHWLRELGCDVRGMTFTSKFKLEPS
jgi:hypothetical protein